MFYVYLSKTSFCIRIQISFPSSTHSEKSFSLSILERHYAYPTLAKLFAVAELAPLLPKHTDHQSFARQ